MLQIHEELTPAALLPLCETTLEAAGGKIHRLARRWRPADGAPVFTVDGQYTSRGWTEWTQGFQFGNALLCFDGTGDAEFLDLGRQATWQQMAGHLTHIGVHDHGFNNVSTYGNLLRLLDEGRFAASDAERELYRLALKVTGAVQAARWSVAAEGLGYIYSFNGPHSLFADTIRSLRALAVAHQLGHQLMGEQDEPINLLQRLLRHAEATARYNVYFGEGRDRYDVRGRVAHESVFNPHNGCYRCPSSQQGYSPFTTWTRGHAWVLCGFAEQLEWLAGRPAQEFALVGHDKATVLDRFAAVARATADFYLEQMPSDGVPYWDTGAPGLSRLGDYQQRPADPFNDHEPVDSSAAAIAAQGLLRLGKYLADQPDGGPGHSYTQAGLTVAATLCQPPYLSTDETHEGLLLHAVYHHPNGWDHIPPGRRVPCGEACLWGDYHLLELVIYLSRLATGAAYLTFFPR